MAVADVRMATGVVGGSDHGRMPQLGRAVYATLGLAILVLVVTYGSMTIWPRIADYRQMRELDRLWHDRSLSPAARAKAAEMLAEFGPEAAPFLIAAANDADDLVRFKAYSLPRGHRSGPRGGGADLHGRLEAGAGTPGPGRGGRIAGSGRLHLAGGPARSAAAHHRIARGGRARRSRRSSAMPCCGPWSAPTR